MLTLYDYQSAIINNVRQHMSEGKRHILVQSPTGSGKTVMFSYIVSEMRKNNKRALIITDRIELLFETGGTLEQFNLKPFHILAGQMVEPPEQFQVYIAMSQTLRRRIGKWHRFFSSFDVVIIDECFIAGTLIDGVPIEKIKVGDYVNSFNHETMKIEKKKVLNLFKNDINKDLIKVNLSCEHFVCTQEHPIFVIGKGYVNAKDLQYGDRVILYNMRKGNEKRKFSFKQLVRQSKEISKKWIFVLFSKMQVRIFRSNAFKKDDNQKSHGKQRNEGENDIHIKKNWSQTKNSGRKWQRNDGTSENSIRKFISRNSIRLVPGINSYYWTKIIEWIKTSISLQDRCRMSIKKDCNRNRWPISLFTNKQKKRFKKDKSFRIERIQSIEIQKRTSIERFEIGDFRNYVYNIEVEDNNNYFANGILVHNCHKQEFNPYFEHDAFNGAFVLGFSATPIRSGKQRQLADDYETIVLGPQVPELIRRHRLVRDKYFGVPHVDMKGVRLNSFGDYQESSMYERFNKRELYSGVIDNWKRLTPDTATLVFCVNIQHSIETCKAFNRAGIPAKFLTSDVSVPKLGHGKAAEVRYQEQLRDYENWKESFRLYSGDRKDVVRKWKRNEFPVLVNAGILTTGFNRKDIETIIVNRATTSLALWLQMLGRGSRTFNGMRSGGWFDKTHFNILDFGGNAQQLGYYNQERTWSLWHEKKKSEGAPPVKVCGKGDPISGVPGKPDKNGNHGCGAYLFASAKICSYCGYIFEQEAKSKHVELVKIDYSQEIDFKENPFDKLEREREARGYKQGWVINRIIAEYGAEGLKKYAKHKGYQNGWLYGTLKRYDHAIRKFQERQRVKSESE